MYYIFGLGNPGLKYKKTRHNAGFMAIDALAKELGIKMKNSKFDAKMGEGFYEGEKIVLIKPQTYMNNSGFSVSGVMNYFNISGDKIIVIYDDMDLAVGNLRIKAKGSAGAHNGMKSIINCIGTQEFPRIRMGIGKPKGEKDVIGHVLGKFGKDENALVEEMTQNAAHAALLIATKGIEAAQQKFN